MYANDAAEEESSARPTKRLVTDGGLITVCPECDSSSIKPRRPGKHSSRASSTGDWYCNECGIRFDEPAERERKNVGARHGLSRKLVEAEPGDLVTDGGREIVFVRSQASGSSISVYHTDRECNTLQQARQIIERERRHVPERASECKHCAGAIGGAADDGHDPDWSAQNLLREAEPGDLVTDGGQVWQPIAGDYSLDRGKWRILFARYSEAGWEFSERVEDVDATMLRSGRGEVSEGDSDLVTDGGQLTDDELTRRARQAGSSLLVWCSRAGLDPHAVLDLVRRERPSWPDGGAETHHCDICDTSFPSVAGLAEHDCDETSEPALVTDGGAELTLAADLVPDIVAALDLSSVVRERAVEICERCDFEHPINRAPTTIAAAAVYLVALAENEQRTQAQVSAAADVSGPAIRDAHQEIREHEAIELEHGEGRIGRPPKGRKTVAERRAKR